MGHVWKRKLSRDRAYSNSYLVGIYRYTLLPFYIYAAAAIEQALYEKVHTSNLGLVVQTHPVAILYSGGFTTINIYIFLHSFLSNIEMKQD